MYTAREREVITSLERIPEKKPAGWERPLCSWRAVEISDSRYRLHSSGTASGLEAIGGVKHERVQHLGHSPDNAHGTGEPEARRIQQFRAECVLFMNGDNLTRSEEHTSELQSHVNLVCRLLL